MRKRRVTGGTPHAHVGQIRLNTKFHLVRADGARVGTAGQPVTDVAGRHERLAPQAEGSTGGLHVGASYGGEEADVHLRRVLLRVVWNSEPVRHHTLVEHSAHFRTRIDRRAIAEEDSRQVAAQPMVLDQPAVNYRRHLPLLL